MSEVSVSGNSSQDLYKLWQEKLKEQESKDSEIKAKEENISLNNADIEVKTANQTQAETALQEATRKVTTEMSNYTSTSAAWSVAQGNVKALAAQAAKEPENETLQAQYKNAKSNLEKLEKSLKEAEVRVQQAKENQVNAENALEQAKTELAEKQELKTNLETELAELKSD